MNSNAIAHRSAFSGWLLLTFISLIVFLYEAFKPVGNPAERITWYSILIIVVAGALTGVCRACKQFDLFEPLYMVFALFLIFFPVRALFAIWLDESWFDPSKAPIWNGFSASMLGFVCFAIGYKICSRNYGVHRLAWLDRSWNLDRAHTVSIVFLLVGLTGFLAVRILGGTFSYFILLDPDIKGPGEIKAWFFYLLWICIAIQVGALIQLGTWLSTGRRTLWTILYCAVALASTILLARYFTVLFLMMLALSWHYAKKKITVIQVAVLFLLVIGYLGVAGLYREWISPGNNLEDTGELLELAGQQNKLALRYVVANLEQLSNVSDVITMTPRELPYQFGLTFTPILLKPIPRTLMPAKPLGASALFSQVLMPDEYDNGLATGLGAWGEWYLNFSWLGLVAGMALTGTLTAAAYKAMRATNGFGRVLLYSSFVVFLFTWLRNDFNSATTYGLYYFIPAILAIAYFTTNGRRPLPSNGISDDLGPRSENSSK